MNLAKITSAATLKLIICRLQGTEEGKSDKELCQELGLSRISLWRARQELRELDQLASDDEPETLFAPDGEEDALDAEAERIDAMDGSGRIGAKRTPAKDKRIMTVTFFAKAWKQLLPEREPLKRRQVEEIVALAEQSQQAGIKPAALSLKVIRILADRKPKQLTISYIKTIVAGEGNGTQPNWQPRTPVVQKKFAPKPGEAATLEEAREARAAIRAQQIAELRALSSGSGPRKIGMFDDEEA